MNESIVPIAVVLSDEARVDSRQIAKALHNQHDSVLSLLNDYSEDFQRFGILRFEIGESVGRGRPPKYALLNENQSYLLLTMVRNTPHVVALKTRLIEAFSEARQKLTVVHQAQALEDDADPVLAQLKTMAYMRREQIALERRVAMQEQQLVAVREELDHSPIQGQDLRTVYDLGQRLGQLMGDYRRAWRLFKDRFQLASYRDLPRCQLNEALNFLRVQIASWQGAPLLESE